MIVQGEYSIRVYRSNICLLCWHCQHNAVTHYAQNRCKPNHQLYMYMYIYTIIKAVASSALIIRELLDKQVNAQEEKTSRVHASSHKPTKVCDENERNKQEKDERVKMLFSLIM